MNVDLADSTDATFEASSVQVESIEILDSISLDLLCEELSDPDRALVVEPEASKFVLRLDIGAVCLAGHIENLEVDNDTLRDTLEVTIED